TWRSSDGVHWSKVAVDLPGLQHAQVQALPAGFAMLALANNGGQPAARLLISSDGASWTPVDLPAGISEVRLAGAVGLVGSRVENGSSVARAVSSADGRSWTALTLPDGVESLSTTIRLASGTYVGVGTVGTMVTSTDGVTWRAPAGLGSPLDSLAVVGGRLVAIARVPSTDVSALWESADGATWRRIALLDGKPLSGTQLVSLGDRVGVLAGSKLTMIGWPGAGGAAAGSPRITATPSAAAPAPSSLTVIVGGWRWHELRGRPNVESTVVRVANGYFGRCGDAMCTSPNGWSWQTPPDPAIFAVDGVARFMPMSVAHKPNGGYVVNAAEGVWYSLDGLHWQPSAAPPDPYGFRAVLYGTSGFALIGSSSDAENRQKVYTSPDGATWTDAGLGPMVITLARGDTSGGIFTQTGKSSTGGVFGYSADGRTWVTSTQPADAYANGSPYRLSDGSLIISGDSSILRSTDGRVWTKMKTGWAPDSLAVAGDRIVATVVGSDNTSVAWESSDDGKTFHKLMDGAGRAEQFGEMVLLQTGTGGSWVGAPLGPSESPGTTPTATGLPGSTPAPAYTPPPTPAGGISKEEAIRIAVNTIHPPAEQAATASASVEMHPRFGWVWHVSFSRDAPSPTGGSGTFVDIDFYTGEVLSSGNWIS
ncbi:MAG TPA: PepSY domain-containing protein, partial [Candidatus Limnocylindrales bacterium]